MRIALLNEGENTDDRTPRNKKEKEKDEHETRLRPKLACGMLKTQTVPAKEKNSAIDDGEAVQYKRNL